MKKNINEKLQALLNLDFSQAEKIFGTLQTENSPSSIGGFNVTPTGVLCACLIWYYTSPNYSCHIHSWHPLFPTDEEMRDCFDEWDEERTDYFPWTMSMEGALEKLLDEQGEFSWKQAISEAYNRLQKAETFTCQRSNFKFNAICGDGSLVGVYDKGRGYAAGEPQPDGFTVKIPYAVKHATDFDTAKGAIALSAAYHHATPIQQWLMRFGGWMNVEVKRLDVLVIPDLESGGGTTPWGGNSRSQYTKTGTAHNGSAQELSSESTNWKYVIDRSSYTELISGATIAIDYSEGHWGSLINSITVAKNVADDELKKFIEDRFGHEESATSGRKFATGIAVADYPA